MTINKRVATFMLAVSALYIVFGIFKFWYLDETVFTNFSRPTPNMSLVKFFWLTISAGLLVLIINIGQLWVLKIFKEKKWVRSGLIVFFCGQALIFLLPLTTLFGSANYNIAQIQFLVQITGKVSTAYMLITFAFVRNRNIRRYYWGFAGLLLLCHLVTYFGPILYDDFGYAWLLINGDVIFFIPFLCSLTLFVEIFNLSRQQNNLANIKIETTGLTE